MMLICEGWIVGVMKGDRWAQLNRGELGRGGGDAEGMEGVDGEL